jgi:hypothetical protein
MSHIQWNVFGTQQIYIGFDSEIKANEVVGLLSGTGENKNFKNAIVKSKGKRQLSEI